MTEAIQTQDPIRLNLGAGDCPLPLYQNLDIKSGKDVQTLDYADNSVDEVRASHLLEHFPHGQTVAIVQEWVRVLKPGGTIRISVPDFDKIQEVYNSRGSYDVPIEAFLMGGQLDEHDRHLAIFNRQKLETLLRAAGCVRVESWQTEREPDTSAHPVSVSLQARKRTPRPAPPAVHFVLSAPRLGFSDMWTSTIEALKAVPNAVMRKVTGAYWGQCIERGMIDAVEKDADYIIALDYDSIFTADDAAELVYLAESYPEADALVPLQSARGWDNPLVSIIDPATGKMRGEFTIDEFQEPIAPISTGHFGLTLLRCDALKKMAHPWFWGTPDAAGTWEKGKIDDDINFWRKFNATGLKAFLACRVVIGHCELMVKWPAKNWQTVHQQLSNYNEKGRPPEVWT